MQLAVHGGCQIAAGARSSSHRKHRRRLLSLRYEPTSFTAWKGEYFANRELREEALVRDDLALDFNWGTRPRLACQRQLSGALARTLNFDPGIYPVVDRG
jgi:hypothetical protein